MKIIISLPGISYSAAKDSFLSKIPEFIDISSFEPTVKNLDVYKEELSQVKFKNLWGINIPNWPLAGTLTSGLAGPGEPADELLHPKDLEKEVFPLLGKYDKWRPYPSSNNEESSSYENKLAKRFSVKRERVFEFIARWMEWEEIIYVDHSTAAFASTQMTSSLEVAEIIIKKAMRSVRHRPGCSCFIFSPYGPGDEPGFILSNKIESSNVSNWMKLRSFLNEQE